MLYAYIYNSLFSHNRNTGIILLFHMADELLVRDPNLMCCVLKSADPLIYYTITDQDMAFPIGKGAYSTVYKGTQSNTQTIVAIKQVSKSSMLMEKIASECSIMAMVRKKQIYNLISILDSIESSKSMYIIMDYYNSGTLSSLIMKNKIESEIEAIEYFRQICFGVKNLHDLRVLHRDIKSENVFVSTYDEKGYPYHYYFVLGDLGLSKEICSSQNTVMVGTAYTMAPEVMNGEYGYKADIYSLGCIYYEMLTRKKPFTGSTEGSIDKLKSQQYLEIKPSFGQLSQLSLRILEGCLQYNESCRIDGEHLFKLLEIDTLYCNYSTIKLPSTAQAIQRIELMPKKATPVPVRKISIYSVNTMRIPCKCYKVTQNKAIKHSVSRECNYIEIDSSKVESSKNNEKNENQYMGKTANSFNLYQKFKNKIVEDYTYKFPIREIISSKKDSENKAQLIIEFTNYILYFVFSDQASRDKYYTSLYKNPEH